MREIGKTTYAIIGYHTKNVVNILEAYIVTRQLWSIIRLIYMVIIVRFLYMFTDRTGTSYIYVYDWWALVELLARAVIPAEGRYRFNIPPA